MTEALGTLEELPEDYRAAMTAAGVAPLWPMMRNVLPHDAPNPVTRPGHWRYPDVRPLLLRAGELTPVEKAERRVLVLSDPGRGTGAMQATASIYLGLQLLLPGETAPAHRHTPSAARIIVEGEGGYTVVDGEKLPMEEGDLVLTPGGEWHDHGHDGDAPVVWLDALDLPLFVYLEGSYAVEGALQAQRNRPDASQAEYFAAGLVPPRPVNAAGPRYPLTRFPWSRTREALDRIAPYAPAAAWQSLITSIPKPASRSCRPWGSLPCACLARRLCPATVFLFCRLSCCGRGRQIHRQRDGDRLGPEGHLHGPAVCGNRSRAERPRLPRSRP